MGTDEPILTMRAITKRFPGVLALDAVDFDACPREVVGLVGENGAGKSTLMRVLAGIDPQDRGEVRLAGRPCRFRTPREAEAAGVAMIHQELSLVPAMSVMENIYLNREPRSKLGLVDFRRMAADARALLGRLDTPIDVTQPAEAYSIATQQMVEIAKALSREARIVVMDEPTSTLNEAETERLFGIVRRLRDSGVAVVFISHKLEEIYRIADRIVVLRDGRLVGAAPAADLPPGKLIQWMVGRTIDQFFPKHTCEPGEELLRVEGLSLRDIGSNRRLVADVSFSLRGGEIVGLAGLRGAGNSELLGALFGRYGRRVSGRVCVRGQAVRITAPNQAIRSRIALVTNDRKAYGLVLPMSVVQNITLASLDRVSRHAWLRPRLERASGGRLSRELAVRAPSLAVDVDTLSGGNQQKVVLAKWLMTEPDILLLDEPTRGIDVGAKAEVYRLMNQWTRAGKGILLITSELPELLAMSDRFLVMHRGRITARLSRDEATQEAITAASMRE
jgi:ABC-type sugar transport system ATPase subunit